MMLLIKNAAVYSPENKGKNDVLIAAGKIISIASLIEVPESLGVKIVDADGLMLTPGFIDAHVHIAGAGGEGGPASRTPELQLSDMIKAGVTTVVGCLGTDGITRSVESVLMKVKSLRAEGVSAWMYTGSYQVPIPTITGDIARDIALIEEVIGVGEVAVSDHRSSLPTVEELSRVAAHARVAGMISGKAGIVNIHLGDAKDPFRPLYKVVENSELTLRQFIPTHINRNEYIFEDAKQYAIQGYVDITTSSYPYFPEYEIKPSSALRQLLDAGVPAEHITFTSDACGSLPGFDPVSGDLVRLESGLPASNLTELRDAVLDEKIPLETALQVLTSNPARILKLKRKGKIAQGLDADLLLLNQNFEIHSVYALGVSLMENYKILKKGTYEK
ncbi:Isoaspartyl dipeptidase [bioreactor metagenome]|uniref:Isoaspartyl dipeptidase n=1 Tax=bioreactor metagenome TaxID=1076179 RepID=A0A644UGL5_9ZZZZ|nr:beta-aspartyl-peptidase [Lentimicrobium sp.]MEA5109190.1 beta-aspartyl-peptidase [Lentimicrobium sp.]